MPCPISWSQTGIEGIHSLGNENKPQIDKPAMIFASYVRGYSSLPLNERALVALRSAHLSKAKHLLPGIEMMALDHGLKPSDIRFIANGRFAPGWNQRAQTLIQATDDLYKKQSIEPRLWKKLQNLYKNEQILDIILCAAAFHLCTF